MPRSFRPGEAMTSILEVVFVNGLPADDIILDTGCSQTLVHSRFVSDSDLLEDQIELRCAHGDSIAYPIAKVSVQIGEQNYHVRAAVSSTLPRDVLLGKDVPDLLNLLTKKPERKCILWSLESKARGRGNEGQQSTL